MTEYEYMQLCEGCGSWRYKLVAILIGTLLLTGMGAAICLFVSWACTVDLFGGY